MSYVLSSFIIEIHNTQELQAGEAEETEINSIDQRPYMYIYARAIQ